MGCLGNQQPSHFILAPLDISEINRGRKLIFGVLVGLYV